MRKILLLMTFLTFASSACKTTKKNDEGSEVKNTGVTYFKGVEALTLQLSMLQGVDEDGRTAPKTFYSPQTSMVSMQNISDFKCETLGFSDDWRCFGEDSPGYRRTGRFLSFRGSAAKNLGQAMIKAGARSRGETPYYFVRAMECMSDERDGRNVCYVDTGN